MMDKHLVARQAQAKQTDEEVCEQIERAKQEWEVTADSLPELVCLLDSQGRILRANRTLEHWGLGSVTDIKGQKIRALFHPAWVADQQLEARLSKE